MFGTARKKLFAAAALAGLASATGGLAGEGPELEFPIESAALVAATAAFFDRVEGTVPGRDRMPVIGRPVLATKASADPATGTEPLTRMGPVDHLTGYRITWYPVEKLLGSVDFMGTWGENRNLVCGYLTWDLTDPDSPRLEQVEASFVDLGKIAGSSHDDIHRNLLDANCAFGAIEANFHFFDAAG